jgi:hypothetical protein
MIVCRCEPGVGHMKYRQTTIFSDLARESLRTALHYIFADDRRPSWHGTDSGRRR